ncbi:N(6)-L-threonylcarbamoyladenine synthase Kae1 [Candidatus Micrarchaeota archaeon]|nr:N(6)-L-threonylcarbamoyladenine synthase Kae1 [Candidatus Micrarchaeota archaeon]
MICLGIETTAHTFGVGIIDERGRALANERDIYKAPAGYGIIPAESAKHHARVAPEILKRALEKANVTLKDVDLIAVSTGPGLPPCLSAGLRFAKTLEKPLIGVNHCVAHIEIGRLTGGMKDPLNVYVSGGNTQIAGYENGRYRVYGETLDIGIGNAIDKFARGIGLEMPGGPKVEALALNGTKYVELPYTVKGMDLTFSGIVTSALKSNASKEDLCYSFQETVYSMLTEVTERALAHAEKKEVMLSGGVAQSKRLQKMIKEMCDGHKASFFVPDASVCGDNGLMIAWTGILARNKPKTPLDIRPRWRTDEVEW